MVYISVAHAIHPVLLSRGHRDELVSVVLHRDLVSEVEERDLYVVFRDNVSEAEVLELGSGAAYHDHFSV